MPAKVKKQGKRWVVIDADTGKVVPSSGHFATRAKAAAQARAINASMFGKKRKA